MEYIHSATGTNGARYDIYRGFDMKHFRLFWNIVPAGSIAPNAGYYNLAYIAKIKGVAL